MMSALPANKHLKRVNKGELDFYPTPQWATRALLAHAPIKLGGTCLEPACGIGTMAEPLKAAFDSVAARDIYDYGYGEKRDFFASHDRFDWIITNPPYDMALAFADRMIRLANKGCAILVRTQFLEGADRCRKLFQACPPAWVLVYAERLNIHKGKIVRKPAGMVSYSWILWHKGNSDTRLGWIPPCRKEMERDEDYATSEKPSSSQCLLQLHQPHTPHPPLSEAIR